MVISAISKEGKQTTWDVTLHSPVIHQSDSISSRGVLVLRGHWEPLDWPMAASERKHMSNSTLGLTLLAVLG